MGDDYPFNYSQGRTLRGSQSGMQLMFEKQQVEEDEEGIHILTWLSHPKGVHCKHSVFFRHAQQVLEVYCEVINQSTAPILLEMLSSFTLGGLSPFLAGSASESLLIHQIRSTWANEGRLVTHPIEEFQLEPSWKPSGANGIRFGQVGSMPNREYFPFLAIEDKKSKVTWGVQLAVSASWQLEAYRKDDALNISGGIADREKGHWMKRLEPREHFETPKALVSVVCGDVDALSQRITRSMEASLLIAPCEKTLPIVFNEFCTTWGNPSQEKLYHIVKLLAEHDISYVVMDAGWYKKHANEANDTWSIEHGDWVCSDVLFPDGLSALTSFIHQKGMKAGIWFEPETCGRNAALFSKNDMLAFRDGYPITAGNRRFLDMRKEEVWEYLDKTMLTLLKKHRFDYVKIDYNANLGLGMDGQESLGTALYDSVKQTEAYFRHIKEELPDILIENCSAGGHRLTEPFLRLSDMSSYSDAHECENIPLVAANMHRMIPVRQSQIWAVLHPEFSDALLYYKLSAAFLGRMCLSGNIEGLSLAQWEIVDKSIAFYKKVIEVIAKGESRILAKTGLSYKEPKGWQAVFRRKNDQLLLVLHTFASCPNEVSLAIEGDFVITDVCARDGIQLNKSKREDATLCVSNLSEWDGMEVLLKLL